MEENKNFKCKCCFKMVSRIGLYVGFCVECQKSHKIKFDEAVRKWNESDEEEDKAMRKYFRGETRSI